MRNIGHSRDFIKVRLAMPKSIWESLIVTARRYHMKPGQLLVEAIRTHLVTQYGHPDIWADHWHQFIENDKLGEGYEKEEDPYSSKGTIEDLGL
jgi:hypothetical protein